MTREEAIDHIKDVICENNTIKPNMVVFEQEKEALNMAIKALEQEPCENRMKYVQETVNTMLNACTTNSIKDKVFRNAARFVQNAIDGKEPDFERIDEPEPCEDAVSAVMHILTELGYGDEENGADAEYMSALCDVAEKVKALPCDRFKLDGMLEDAYEHGYQQARHDYEVQPCEDAVSREAVLDAVKNNYRMAAIDVIEKLPSVIPKPMEYEDLVSREFMYKLGAKCIATRNENGVLVAIASIESLPPVTPKQRTGHWEMPQLDDGMSDPIYYQVRCSECGFDLDPQTWHMELHQYGADKYCPNCGAKMEGERE